MDSFISLLQSLGFSHDERNALLWYWRGPECDGVVVELSPVSDDVSANYSSEYSNEDDVVRWDGSLYSLDSFQNWFDSL